MSKHMLAFAAFIPHPVIAVPDVGKDHQSKIRSTLKAYRLLAQELHAAKVSCVVCISPHAPSIEGAITINQQPIVEVAFRDFGNLSDNIRLANHIGLGYAIRESVETELPVHLIENEILDYGSSIALWHLLHGRQLDDMRVIPIGTASALTLAQHYDLGVAVNKKVHQTTERIAVIASGDLSHGASKRAPGGYIPKASAFNTMVRDAVAKHDVQSILSFEQSKFPGISECGLRPLAVAYGIIHERACSVDVLSFENPFGIGYLAAQFRVR